MYSDKGWVKFYREWLENPTITKDSKHLFTWCYLLVKATPVERYDYFNGKKILLRRGQLISSRKDIYKFLKIERNKLDRILKLFETEKLIELQTTNHKTLITLVDWDFYQGTDE